MALRGTLTHRKTRRLAKLLGISPCFALGILEALWHFAGDQRPPTGDLGALSAQDLADELFFEGDAQALVDALVGSGWLALDVPGVALYVKGWDEHADSYVQAKLAKQTLLFANGRMPIVPHDAFNAESRKRILAAYEQAFLGITTRGEDEPPAAGSAVPAGPYPPQNGPGQVPDKSPGEGGDGGTSSGHTSAGGSSGSGSSSSSGGKREESASAPAAVEINGQWAPLGTRLDHAEIRFELARIEATRAGKRPRPLGPVPFGDVQILVSVIESNGVSDDRFLAFLRYVNSNRWASAKGDMLMRFLRDNPLPQGTRNSEVIPSGRKPRSQWTPEEIAAHEAELLRVAAEVRS